MTYGTNRNVYSATIHQKTRKQRKSKSKKTTNSNACGIYMPVLHFTYVQHTCRSSELKEERKRKKGREKTLFSFVTHTVYLRVLADQTNAHITIPLTSAERTRREECWDKTGWWWWWGGEVGVGGRFSQSSITITIINVQSSPNV